MMATVFLLRHAESAPSKTLDEAKWSLSQNGERQALEIRDFLAPLKIEHIFSSPYERALATIYPFAREMNLEVNVVHDLRERKLTEGFIDNFQEIVKLAWTDFDFALPNCESSNACQTRMKRCIDNLVESNPGRRILISSHGNAIGLYLNALDVSFGFEQWAAMKNPDLFKIIYRDGLPIWESDFIYRS